MAYDRPSWREIDQMRDQSGKRKHREENKHEMREHSTRYDKYKSDLNRLFDQGLAGSLLKKTGKERTSSQRTGRRKAKAAVTIRKGNGRIPQNSRASTSRLKIFRGVIDAEDQESLTRAVDELVDRFGMPDDLEVLVRILEHRDEELVLEAVSKMKKLLSNVAKIPRRFTLKERLRSLAQTAAGGELRQLARELEERL